MSLTVCGLQELKYLWRRDYSNVGELQLEKTDTLLRAASYLPLFTSLHTLKLSSLADFSEAQCEALVGGLLFTSSLQKLDLSGNYLSASCAKILSRGISSLKNLFSVDLSGNQLGPEGCMYIANALRSSAATITHLNLSFNLVGPSGLKQLAELLLRHCTSFKELILIGNNVATEGCVHLLNAMKNDNLLCGALTTLEALDLSYNQIIFLPSELCRLPTLTYLSLRGNLSILSPPSFLAQFRNCCQDLKEYNRYIEEKGGIEFRRAKVILVGDEMAGKTSLMRSLLSEKPSLTTFEERTKVLDTASLVVGEKNKILINFFDFGGQDHYRSTIQLFLGGGRVVYVLLQPMDKEPQRASIESWVRCIAARSPQAVLLLIASKIDLCPSEDLLHERLDMFHSICEEVIAVLEAQYSRKRVVLKIKGLGLALAKEIEQSHVNITIPSSPQEISSSDYLQNGGSLKSIKNSIFDAVESISHLKEIIPLPWSRLIEEVEHMALHPSHSLKTIMTIQEFWASVQSKCSFENEEELRQSLRFAHSIGFLLYFDTSEVLRDIIFLRPQWVANILKVVMRHDFLRVASLEPSVLSYYTLGSVQHSQDIHALLSCGLLLHRLIPSLLQLRILELQQELLSLTSS